METELISKKFESMGARVKFRLQTFFSVDVKKDQKGEFFEIHVGDEETENISVLDIRPQDRHLVLMVKEYDLEKGTVKNKSKFLCGHDERFWFAAAIPENSRVSTVWDAKEALKPNVVQSRQTFHHIKTKDRNKRKNKAYIRQGEWFFIPEPYISPDPKMVLTNEPIRRGRSKPHIAQFAYREGGTTVYVNDSHPNGLKEKEYKLYLRNHPDEKQENWKVMTRDPGLYVKGTITHPDHKTVTLSFWHKVEMNTEHLASAGRHLAFLD